MKLILVSVALVVTVMSCNKSKKDIAQKKVDAYTAYVDSVSNVETDEAVKNWETIENDYREMESEASKTVVELENNTELQNSIDESAVKYEAYKAEVVEEHERMESERLKTELRKSLLGKGYTGDDMKFTWINKDNILSVYQNFVDTVDKNKDSYSREDWDEIKLIYEAIDTRKNTVENEGLTSEDNRKIAGLKVKFSSMYTVNRIGAKSDENAEAKEQS
ncbi:MAG TPA: hypothetical protein VKN14_13450 [Flavobacteriaceae bacterium]|nr:hypothetical protein [Flavobacteriaceae bacterium]